MMVPPSLFHDLTVIKNLRMRGDWVKQERPTLEIAHLQVYWYWQILMLGSLWNIFILPYYPSILYRITDQTIQIRHEEGMKLIT
jgi:hypothetical protein